MARTSFTVDVEALKYAMCMRPGFCSVYVLEVGILQQLLDERIRDALYRAFSDLIADRLDAKGISLSEYDRDRLIAALQSNTNNVFRIRRWRWWEKEQVSIEITDEDFAKFESDFSQSLEDRLPTVVNDIVDELAERILETLRKHWKRQLRSEDRVARRFRRGLRKRWEPALSLLRLFVAISREFGEEVIAAYLKSEDQSQRQLMELLARLHARACQVSEEVICLLGAGFADGAMARWRTLHEIAVVALLVSDRGGDLAERYIAHEVIESTKAAREYQEHFATLGFEPLTPDQLKELEQQYEGLVGKYGPDFKSQYGWATSIVNKRRPTFADLEKAVGAEHLRSYYRMASYQVHSSAKGVFFKLGLMDEMDALLTGPSDFGLADPGQSTAISLSQATVALVMAAPNLDGIVGAKMLAALTPEICEEFARLQSQYPDAEV